jgi:hypothetical protein
VPEILIEVSQVPRAGGDLRPKIAVPEEFERRAEEVAQSIANVATKLRAKLEQAMAEKPEGRWALKETEVKFGVSLQTEAGVVVARAQAGATFEVTLRWSAPSEPPE